MRAIFLEDGTKVEISNESYEALQKAVPKPVWEDVIKKKMPENKLANLTFSGWGDNANRYWLNNKQSKKEFEIYLRMLLWKDTYDKDFVPDWKDKTQIKFYIHYHHYLKEWVWNGSSEVQRIMQVYVSSQEKAEQMIKDLKSIGIIN